MLKAAGEAKAVDRTRVVDQARAADAPKEPLARRSGTEALGAWGASACIGLQGRRRSGAGSEGNLAGAGASGATKGFGGRRTGAVVGGLLTETAVKRMSCSRSSSFVPQWTSPSRGRSTWCPLLLRWKARMHVSVCCCCARAWLWRRSRCGGAHFWVVYCVAGCEVGRVWPTSSVTVVQVSHGPCAVVGRSAPAAPSVGGLSERAGGRNRALATTQLDGKQLDGKH